MFNTNRLLESLLWYRQRVSLARRSNFIAKIPTNRWTWSTLAIPLIVSLILRLYQLSTESLWIDEMLSYEDGMLMASKVFNELGVRPLYYILLKVWMIGGQSDAWLRGFSVVVDLVAISLAFWLCQYLFNRRTAFLTAFVMALSPLMINHAQEIRMYPLINVFTLGGTLALAHALNNPAKKWIGLWAVMRLLGILTSPLMILMFLPDTVLYGFKYWRRWPQLRLFGYGLVFVAFAWGPIALGALFHATSDYATEHANSNGLSLPISEIFGMLTNFTVYWPLVGLESLSTPLPELYYKFFTVLLAFILLLALLKIKLSPDNKVLWLAAWAFLPAIVHFLGSELFLSGALFRVRYFLYVSPYVIMLLAYGFERIRNWQPKVASLVAMLYLIAAFGGLAQYYTQLYRDDWRGVATAVEAMEQPGDVVINFTLMGNYSFPRYYEGDAAVATIHIPRSLARCSIKEPEVTAGEISPAMAACLDERAKLVQASLSQLPEAKSMWLVCFTDCEIGKDYERIAKTVLGENLRETSEQRFDTLSKHDFSAIELHHLESLN